MKFPDEATVLFKLAEPPTYISDHLKMEAWVLSESHRRTAARCVEDVAIYHHLTAKKAVLEPFRVDRLIETYNLQQSFKLKYSEEAMSVIRALEHIEKRQQNKV